MELNFYQNVISGFLILFLHGCVFILTGKYIYNPYTLYYKI